MHNLTCDWSSNEKKNANFTLRTNEGFKQLYHSMAVKRNEKYICTMYVLIIKTRKKGT